MTIIQMEGFTMSVDGLTIKTKVRTQKTDKEIWRTVPQGGPVWQRAMAVAEQANDHYKHTGEMEPGFSQGGPSEEDVKAYEEQQAEEQPEEQPEAEKVSVKEETLKERKNRQARERRAAKNAAKAAE